MGKITWPEFYCGFVAFLHGSHRSRSFSWYKDPGNPESECIEQVELVPLHLNPPDGCFYSYVGTSVLIEAVVSRVSHPREGVKAVSLKIKGAERSTLGRVTPQQAGNGLVRGGKFTLNFTGRQQRFCFQPPAGMMDRKEVPHHFKNSITDGHTWQNTGINMGSLLSVAMGLSDTSEIDLPPFLVQVDEAAS